MVPSSLVILAIGLPTLSASGTAFGTLFSARQFILYRFLIRLEDSPGFHSYVHPFSTHSRPKERKNRHKHIQVFDVHRGFFRREDWSAQRFSNLFLFLFLLQLSRSYQSCALTYLSRLLSLSFLG